MKRILAILLFAYLLTGCGTVLKPFPPPTATHGPATHIPTRTLTPLPPPLFILPVTETWTPTSTNLPPSTPTFTATATAFIAPTNTAIPSLTPTLPTGQPGRSLITPPAMTLPSTGGEPNQTATPRACKYYSLQLGMLGDDIVIYLQCVKDLIGNEVS